MPPSTGDCKKDFCDSPAIASMGHQMVCGFPECFGCAECVKPSEPPKPYMPPSMPHMPPSTGECKKDFCHSPAIASMGHQMVCGFPECFGCAECGKLSEPPKPYMPPSMPHMPTSMPHMPPSMPSEPNMPTSMPSEPYMPPSTPSEPPMPPSMPHMPPSTGDCKKDFCDSPAIASMGHQMV